MSFPHWSRTLKPFKQANSYRSAQKPDRRRKASRKETISNAWIALDGGFAVRSCSVVDLSNTGVQIKIDPADFVPSYFTLMMSRNSGTGRRARVIWRRGSKIGAQFL
jgi:hypothetical protein